ncbi:uncharacterized protein LOC132610464 [Lycium barbarum]|uniref:uncharacterized protein LOC132610464 n=1 Tax=Lycium barbarum TaxID=112863 RepID=UPI00293EC8BF|nr:uncharacterized protein LOC132610464 [Lycium barbarum]
MDPKCVLCKFEDKTGDHLFAECPYTTRVWDRLLQWLQIQHNPRHSWLMHYQWVLYDIKGRTVRAKILKMVYAEFIHSIWKKRNARIFEHIEKPEGVIARNIACTCNVRAMSTSRQFLDSCMF